MVELSTSTQKRRRVTQCKNPLTQPWRDVGALGLLTSVMLELPNAEFKRASGEVLDNVVDLALERVHVGDHVEDGVGVAHHVAQSARVLLHLLVQLAEAPVQSESGKWLR